MDKSSSDVTNSFMMEELREKLRISEESRKSLQHKFDVMMQTYRIKEQARYNALKRRYGNFLEEDQRRQQRNENLLQMLERIDMRTSKLAARTERLSLLRRHYDQYLGRVYPTWRATSHHRTPTSAAASVKVREDPDDDVSGYGTHTGSSGYFRDTSRYAEQPRMVPMSTLKQSVPSYKVDNVLPDKYRLPRVEFDTPSISVIRPTEVPPINDYRTRSSPIELRNDAREMNQPRIRQEFGTMDTRRERFSPRDVRDLTDFSPRDARDLPDFSPRDRRDQSDFSPRGVRELPDFSPRDRREQSDFSPRGVRDQADFSPRGARDFPDFSPRERIGRRQQNLAPPELEVDQNTSGDLLNMSLSDDGVSSLSKSDADAEMYRRHHWETLKQAYLNRSQVPRDAERNEALDEDPRDVDWSHQRVKPHDKYDIGPTRKEERLPEELSLDQGSLEKESFRDKIRRLKIMVQENKKLEQLADTKQPREPSRSRNTDENTDENDHLDQTGRRQSVLDTQSSPKPDQLFSQERLAVGHETQEDSQEEKPIQENIRTRRMSVLQADQYTAVAQKQPSLDEANSEYRRRNSQQWAEEEREKEIQERNSTMENQSGVESQRRQSGYQEFLQGNEDKEHRRSPRDVNTKRDSVSSYNNEQNDANLNIHAGHEGQYPDEQSGAQYNEELRQEFAATEQQTPLKNERRDSVRQDDSPHIISNPGADNYHYEGTEYEKYSAPEAKNTQQISNNNEGETQYYQDNSGYVDNQEQQHPDSYTGANQNYPPQNYDYNQGNAQYAYEQGYAGNQDNTYSQGKEDYEQGQQDYNQSSEQGYYQDNAVYAQQRSNDDARYVPNQEYPTQEGYAHQYDNQGSQQQQQYDNQGSQQQYANQDTQQEQQYPNQDSQQQQQYPNQDSQQQQHQYDNQDSQQHQYADQDSQQKQKYGGDSMGWAQDPSQRQDERAQNDQYGYYDQQNQGEYRQETQSRQDNEYNYQQQDPDPNYGSAAGERPDSSLMNDERAKYAEDDAGRQTVSDDSTQNSDLSHERIAGQGQQSPSQRSVDRYRTMLGVDPNSEPSYSEVDEIEAEMAAVVAGGTKDIQPETQEGTNPPQPPTDLPASPTQNQPTPVADSKPPQMHDDSSDFDYSTGP